MLALTKSQLISLIYHDLFDYPLTKSELNKWQADKNFALRSFSEVGSIQYNKTHNLYYLNNREKLINLRLNRQKYSKQKLKIAKSATQKLSLIPTIQFIGLTGSLAMNNADKNSDIDLLIITIPNTLWLTRLITYAYSKLIKLNIRNPHKKQERDLLCMNIWLDGGDLKINTKNIYTAHELAQIKPLINKNNYYERLLFQNKWLLDYWPHAIKITNPKTKIFISLYLYILISPLNYLSYYFQRLYMSKKLTNEKINISQAFFHPRNYSKIISKKLSYINIP